MTKRLKLLTFQRGLDEGLEAQGKSQPFAEPRAKLVAFCSQPAEPRDNNFILGNIRCAFLPRESRMTSHCGKYSAIQAQRMRSACPFGESRGTRVEYEPAVYAPRVTRVWESKFNKKWHNLKDVEARKQANLQIKELLEEERQ